MTSMLNPRTPVVIGVGAVTQRETDPTVAVGALDLMEMAAREAASEAVLAEVQHVLTPKGTWSNSNPGGVLAKRFGATASTTLTDLGVLQTSLFGRAMQAIADGAEVVLVAGGEAKARDGYARRADIALTPEPDDAGDPGEFVRPQGMVISQLEIDTGLIQAVFQYALIDNARRHARGWTMQQQTEAIAQLWGGMGEVAASYPRAWNTTPPSAAELATPEGAGRMLATPYRKHHVTQWNVDQAQALVFASVEKAEALGIPRDQWVFPLGVAESNLMVPVTERADLAAVPQVGIAGRRLAEATGVAPAAADHIELYSCFPVAVAAQMDELGIVDRVPTVTGGMAFGGGPFNNSVLGGAVPVIELVRESGGTGLSSAVSGMLTKQGLVQWSATPPAASPVVLDITEEAAAVVTPVPCAEPQPGAATVVSDTVLYGREGPDRAVGLLQYADGTRTISSSTDAGLMTAIETTETIGRDATVQPDGTFTLI